MEKGKNENSKINRCVCCCSKYDTQHTGCCLRSSGSTWHLTLNGATFSNGELVAEASYPVAIYFTWSDTVGDLTTPGSGTYDIEISTDETFLNSTAIVASSDHKHAPHMGCSRNKPDYASPAVFQPATSYYVRIQAYDTTCNGDYVTGGSGWAEYTFYTSIAAPTLISPADGSTLVNNLDNDHANLFTWDSVAGATGYVLEVDTSTTFNSLYINVALPATQNYYTPTGDLPSDTTFYWQVETLSNSPYSPSAWSNPSSTWSFTTANVSPAPAPLQISTGQGNNGKATNDFTPGLRWNEIALPGGTTFTTYEVEVSTNSTFDHSTALCFNVTNMQVSSLGNQSDANLTTDHLDVGEALAAVPLPPSHCPTSAGGSKLSPTTAYYWRVQCRRQRRMERLVKRFQLLISYPKVDATSFSTTKDPIKNTITFSWADTVPPPYNYGIQICATSNFAEGSSRWSISW